MRVTISQEYLKAVLLFAAKKDVRYYLKGVLLEATPRETRVTAADGAALACLQYTPTAGDNDGVCAGVIIPREVIETVCKWRVGSTPVSFYIDEEKRDHYVECMGQRLVFTDIDGKFPDYRRVIPTTLSGEKSYVNGVLIARAQQLIEIIDGKATKRIAALQQNGNGACMVDTGWPNIAVIVMPFRAYKDGESFSVPTWASGALA